MRVGQVDMDPYWVECEEGAMVANEFELAIGPELTEEIRRVQKQWDFIQGRINNAWRIHRQLTHPDHQYSD